MLWVSLILFFLGSLLVQMELPVAVLGMPVAVELLFVAVIFFALVRGSRRGLLAGMAAGAIQDAASLTPFGLNLFCFAILGTLVGALRQILFVEKLSTRLVFVLLFTFLLQGMRYFFFFVRGGDLPGAPDFLSTIASLLFWNALASFAMWPAMKYLGLAQPTEEDREILSAQYFSRFRRRLGRKVFSQEKKEWSWK